MHKASLVLFAGLLFVSTATAQDGAIPMNNSRWEAPPNAVEFTTHEGTPAARILDGSASLTLRNADFSNGTITFDVALEDAGFIGIHVRQSADQAESEYVYLRAFWPVAPRSRNAVQYTTVTKNVSLWDLTDEYQGAARLLRGPWNRVKLVVSGYQMRVYVNDMERPTLHIPILEGTTQSGGISLVGQATFANVVVQPGVTEDVPAAAGYDPTSSDTRYLRAWEVTPPQDFPFGRALVLDVPMAAGSDVALEPDMPSDATTWTPLAASATSRRAAPR